MSQKVLENIYRIIVPLPQNPLKTLNSYLIKGSERNLLIDTGFRHKQCYEVLTDELKNLGISMENTDILLTHLHSDHTGLAPDIASDSTKIYLSREEIDWMYGKPREECWKKDDIKLLRAGFDKKVIDHDLKNAPTRAMANDPTFTRFLPIDDGQIFHYGGYDLKAVKTPGHTPAHMCLWMEEQKTMFTGDHVLFDITPNITFWFEMEDSLGSYMESLKKIDKYDVQLALPGHRESGDFHSRIATLLKHHKDRLDECYQVVKCNPGLSSLEIAGKMSWNIRCSSWEDFPVSQKWFAVAECQSHLRHLEVLGYLHADYSEDTIHYEVV